MPKTTEQNQIVCTGKSEAEVGLTNSKKTALEVLYCWRYLQTDTKHRTAFLRQQSFS